MFGPGQKLELRPKLVAAALAFALALIFGATQLRMQRADAYVGPVTTRPIVTDSVSATTPATWNAHMSKLVTDGTWSYAVFTRFPQDLAGRVAWIYKRRVGSPTWEYTGRELDAVHQPPTLALDRAGHLHVAFDCLAGFVCTSGGVAGDSNTRFYDLIFYAHNRDGSLQLGAQPDQFWKYNEQTAEAYGYMGLSTDPSPKGSQTFVSVLNDQWDQLLLRVGSPAEQVVPHVAPPSYVLYPQMPISPVTGKRYYIGQELVPHGVSGQYKAIAAYTASPNFRLRFADYQSDPDAVTRFVRVSDSSFGPDGRLYFLYIKMPAVNGNCSYLVREKSPGSGRFSAPLPVGCHDIYAQLQVDSSGTINILDSSGLSFVLSQSGDGGRSWHETTLPLPVGGAGVPSGSQSLANPTLVKPWTSPRGYNPDVLHGVLANWSEPNMDNGGDSWGETEFSIPVSARTQYCNGGQQSCSQAKRKHRKHGKHRKHRKHR